MKTISGAKMKRFFFDYKAKEDLLLDYRGQDFTTARSACEFAQEIVQNLKHSLDTDWSGWSVEVHTADGEKYFSFPVGCELSAL